ncbi:MAG: N-methyl-L-tryptophan oxidase [Pseudonocardiales bacterium]|nr:N-methyl-L-tryptophan oxidase [Pseudonocardiales bacterium]
MTSSSAERHFAAIVLGVGAIGAATAYRIAGRRGGDVLAIEQYELGHGMGASEDHSRIIRHAYHSTDYTALTAQAYAAWGEVEERTGLTLVTRTGGIDIGIGTRGDAMAASYEQALTAAGHPFSVLDAAALRAQQPQWRVPDDAVAVYQADSGILDIRKANAAHVALARQEGATFLERTHVERIESLPDRVVVHTDRGSFSADTLSVCAGSWTPTALHGLDVSVPLTLTHEQVTYWATPNLRAFAPDRFGVWIYHESDATYYGFPVYGEAATKAGRDVSGKVVTQETRSWEPDEDNRAGLTRFMADHLPDALGPELMTKACVYDLTADRNFLLDSVPGHPRIAFFVGAGHAAKFAALVGCVLADLACDGGTSTPIDAFRYDRPAITDPDYPTDFAFVAATTSTGMAATSLT